MSKIVHSGLWYGLSVATVSIWTVSSTYWALVPHPPDLVADTLHPVQAGLVYNTCWQRNNKYTVCWLIMKCSLTPWSDAYLLLFSSCFFSGCLTDFSCLPLSIVCRQSLTLSLLHLPAGSKFSSLLRAFSHSPQATPPQSKPLFQAVDPSSLLPVGGLPPGMHFLFQLKDNCFTVLCKFLWYYSMNQLQVCIYTPPLGLLPPSPILPL